MPQTAKGTIVGIPDKQLFIAKFIISEQLYEFRGNISGTNTGFPPSPSDATLTYNDVMQLNGSRSFEAMIGTDDKNKFKIELSNKVTIDGTLSVAAPVPGVVFGSGMWSGGRGD